jgi:hypothetical protein
MSFSPAPTPSAIVVGTFSGQLNHNNDMNGAILVDNFTAQSEVRLPAYNGFIPQVSSAPEPTSLSLLVVPAAIGFVIALRALRRRRRGAAAS